MTDFKKGGPLQNSNIFATNRLFVKNPLFKKKKKKRAPGVYNPKAKFKYEDGGDISIPELNKGGKPCPPGQQYNPYTKRCEAKLEDRTFLNLMRDRKYGSLQQFKQAPKSSYNPEYIQNLKEFTITASKKAKAKKNKKKTDAFNSDYEKLVEQYDKLRNSPLLANQEKAEGLLRQIKEIELYTPPKNQISFEGDAVEDFINKNILDDAMGKASVSAAATVGEDEDEIDNFRHPQAGRYAAEAIVNYFPEWAQYTGIPQTAGLWGANAMGVGHELGTIFGDPRWFDDTYPDNKAPGFLEKAKIILGESGEDIFNNAIGAGVGVLPMNSRDKTNTLLELSNQNMLPDGIVRRNPSNNLYLKKGPNDPGKFKSPYKQELGGSIIDLTEEEIQKYIDGGYVVEEVNDPSIPKLDRLKPGGAPCPRGQMRDASGKCVPYNWGTGNVQAADSYTGMYGGYDSSGTKNLTEVKASAKKGKKLSDYILRGGKTKADEARKLGKNAGQYFGMPGEALEPVNFTKAGLEKYKKEIKDAKKNYEAEEKNKAEYEKARKKLEKSKDQSAGTKFRQEYEKKGWDRFDTDVAEGTGPGADYSATAARKEWGDSDQWNKFTGLVSNAATAIPLLGAAGAAGTAGAAILENPYVQAGLTGYGLYDATTNTLPEAYKDFSEGRYLEGAGNVALAGLDLVPGVGLAGKGAKLAGKGVKGVANYGNDVIQTSKQAGKLALPKYKNVYRVEHADFNQVANADDLTGRWFADNPIETKFYAKNLKDPVTGEVIRDVDAPTRVMQQRLPEYKVQQNFGAGMPEEARTMSMGRGDFTNTELDEMLGAGAGDRFTKGVFTESDLNAMETAPFLFRKEEGILDADMVNKIRGNTNAGRFSSGKSTVFDSQDKAVDYLFDEASKIYKPKSKYSQYLPFKEGGASKGCKDGEYWDGTKCTKLITLKNDKKYIDGVANWAMHVSDPNKISGDYNDQIKDRLYSGKWGLDPQTGALVKLSAVQPKSVTTVDAKTKASREKEKLAEKNYRAEEENKKAYEQSIIGAGFDPATFGKAKGVNTITGEPIYASSKEEAERINQEAINQAAIEGHAAVVNNPVFKTAANFTPVGMAVGAIEGLARFIPDAYTLAQDPTLANAGQLGMDALQALPFAKPIANTVKSAVQNTYKINPWAFKPNPEAYYHRSPKLENIINKEENILQGFAKSDEGVAYSKNRLQANGEYLRPANEQLYFSKGVPLDKGRYNTAKNAAKEHVDVNYPGPYIAEIEGVPMGASVSGRIPASNAPTKLGDYAVPHRPIALDEAKFYKEHWLKGYVPVDKSKVIANIPDKVIPNKVVIPDTAIGVPEYQWKQMSDIHKKAFQEKYGDSLHIMPDEEYSAWSQKPEVQMNMRNRAMQEQASRNNPSSTAFYKSKNTGTNTSTGLTDADIAAARAEEEAWLTSDEYRRRRTRNTGESVKAVKEDVAKILKRSDEATYNLDTKIKGAHGAMSTNPFMNPRVSISSTAPNPKATLRHENIHLYSPASAKKTLFSKDLHKNWDKPNVAELKASERGVYANYPTIGDSPESIIYADPSDYHYNMLGYEQQARHLGAMRDIAAKNNVDIKAGKKLTEGQVRNHMEDWINTRENVDYDYDKIWGAEILNERKKLADAFGAPLDEIKKIDPDKYKEIIKVSKDNAAKTITKVLNNAWVVAPTVGVAGTATMLANPFQGSDGLQQQKKGGSTDEYIELDIPEEKIQWYIDNGYRVEPVTKLKKFIG